MPIVDIMAGSIRSESFPAYGAIITITSGCAIRISPVVWGLNAFICCRYRLIRKVRANVAAKWIIAAMLEKVNTLLVLNNRTSKTGNSACNSHLTKIIIPIIPTAAIQILLMSR